MPKHTTSQAPHQTRGGGLLLSRIQTGLALGLVGIGLVIAFGGGFIVGMWYQASEQITPYDPVPVESLGSDDATQPLTFYSTLTKPATESATSESPATPVAASEAHRPEKAESVAVRAATSGPDTARPAPAGFQPPGSEPARPTPPAPPPEPPATKPSRTPPAPPPEPPATKPSRTLPAPQPAMAQSADGRYSVQVGSFRAREQAEELRGRLRSKGYAARIQLTRIPGKGIWYRVRVGRFADRAAASRAAQRLENRERLSVLIMDEAG
jgi:cell division protein FtsN